MASIRSSAVPAPQAAASTRSSIASWARAMTASYRAAFDPKWYVMAPRFAPATDVISRTEAPANPFAANTCSEASRRASLVFSGGSAACFIRSYEFIQVYDRLSGVLVKGFRAHRDTEQGPRGSVYRPGS